ncbi:MFS transporter [Saccharopolyspora sp. NPDC050389]|uniref:MFS transporter n=1 Tax=Saccharopolyspora sp. NPDC050389 TaxID=3155516 RepID=UPI0033CBED2E
MEVRVFGSLPRPVKVLLGVRVLNQLGAYVLAFLAVLAGPDLAAVALAVFGVAALISRWAGGLLLDKLSPRTVIASGLTATGAALLILAAAQSPAQVVVAVALVGLAFEIYEPASQELLARLTEGDQRQDAYALLGTSLVAAGAIGGVLAAVVLPLGVRWLMVVDGVTCVAAAVVTMAFLGRETAQMTTPGQERGHPGARWRPSALLVTLTLAGTAFAFGYLAVLMFMPFVLLQQGAPAWLPGLTLTGSALLVPLVVRLTRTPVNALSHTMALACGTTLLGVLALVMVLGDGLVAIISAYLGWVAVNSVLLGRWQAMIAEIAPAAERPRWFAFHGSSWGIAQPAVPAVVAVAAGIAGGTGAAAFLTAAVAFLAVPLLLTTTPWLIPMTGSRTR